ncbi:hypothetical protein AAC387_Pa05g0434 [Persea americana]
MEFLLNSTEFVKDSSEFSNSFTKGFHGAADPEPIGPNLELAGCEEGDVAEVAIDAHNLTVSLQGEEDTVRVGGMELEVV